MGLCTLQGEYEKLPQASIEEADDSVNNNQNEWREESLEKLVQKIKQQTQDW